MYDGVWQKVISASLQTHWLYDKGDEYTALTGGWIDDGSASGGNQYYPKALSITRGDVLLSASITGASSGAIFRPSNMIDLTDYSKIKITCSCSAGAVTGYNYIRLAVAKVLSPGISNTTFAATTYLLNPNTTGNSGTFTLEVGSFTGYYYICINLLTNTAGSSVIVRIENMWLE